MRVRIRARFRFRVRIKVRVSYAFSPRTKLEYMHHLVPSDFIV